MRKAFRVAVSRMPLPYRFWRHVSSERRFHAQQQEQESENLVPQPLREKQFPVGISFTVLNINGRAFPGENPAMTLDSTFRAAWLCGVQQLSLPLPIRRRSKASP